MVEIMSERVVKGFVASGTLVNLKDKGKTRWPIYARPYAKNGNCVPVTILPQKDGAVGPILPWMVEWLIEGEGLNPKPSGE